MKELKDEKLFPRQSNVVTVQCSGTRRIEQIHEYPGDGDELINAPVRSSLKPLDKNRQELMRDSGVKVPSEPHDGPASLSKNSSNTVVDSKTPNQTPISSS